MLCAKNNCSSLSFKVTLLYHTSYNDKLLRFWTLEADNLAVITILLSLALNFRSFQTIVYMGMCTNFR